MNRSRSVVLSDHSDRAVDLSAQRVEWGAAAALRDRHRDVDGAAATPGMCSATTTPTGLLSLCTYLVSTDAIAGFRHLQRAAIAHAGRLTG